MQANGQYGVPPEVPQYGVGRGPPSHSHMFNISHDVSLSPSSGHPHHGHSPHPHPHHHQQHLQQQHTHHQQPPSQHSQHHTQSQQAQQEHAHQQSVQRQHQSTQPNQILPPHHSQDIQQHHMLQQLNLGQESPKALSPIASRPPPNNINKALAVVTDQSLVLEDHDGLGEEGDRGTAGNRWPRQETLALLNIRLEMDAAFRDSSLKGPLWEEISRKLGDMGYQRSAKKCKEKFENLHKYYKRTKDGKAGRQDGKSYRFFSQLEALYGNANEPSNTVNNIASGIFAGGGSSRNAGIVGGSVVGASGGGQSNTPQLDRSGSFLLARGPLAGPSAAGRSIPQSGYRPVLEDSSGLNFSCGSSEDDDDDDPRDSSDMPESRKRKRSPSGKLMAFFESQLKKLLEKQEQLQQKFLDALERRDNDRMIREEAWKRQELARLTREHELRAQERSLAATKDAALVAFLQKVTGQTLQLPPIAIPTQYPVHSTTPADTSHAEDHSEREGFDPNSKRWPKPEVLALIKLRSDLQPKFADSGPKGPLWQEVSSGMASRGYSRSAKRCKEKWENINKYFKKAKESSKKRPENAKTCPYFHQLDALYRKGILGSPTTQLKQLPYKVTDLSTEDELVSQPHQASGSHTDDISGQVLAIMPPETSTAVPEVTTSTTNAGGVAAVHVFSFSGESGTSNDGIHPKAKLKPSGQIDLGSGDTSLAASIGAKILSGSQVVRQASSSDLGKQPEESTRTDSQLQHDQQPPAAYHPEFEKTDLEHEAGLVEHKESQQQNQLQYEPNERAPSLPANLVSSPMALHVEKFSSDPATEGNIATSANS